MKHCYGLDIETSSLCNRRCATCIRNSNPNREEMADWFEQRLMPMETIKAILDQAVAARYHYGVILSHYNEPLLDPRLVEIATLARSYRRFLVRLVTNGDALTPELASRLDGVLNDITISLYMPAGKERERKRELLKSLFRKTRLFITDGVHGIVHFHPAGNPARVINDPCLRTKRMIINHRGQYLLCCDDVTGHFDLGRFPETSLVDYWRGQKRREIVERLANAGGRKFHPYCMTCPR